MSLPSEKMPQFRKLKVFSLTIAVPLGLVFGWLLWIQRAPRPVSTHAVAAEVKTNTRTRPSVAVMLADVRAGKGDRLSLTRDQVMRFLEQEKRSAVSLLFASLVCEGGEAFREEAAERYPEDPVVAAWMMPIPGGSPVPKAEWVDRLRRNDPENALGWYQAARAALHEGRDDDALALLTEAATKKDFHFYADKFSEVAKRAWLSSGYSDLEAEAIGMSTGEMMQGHLYAMEMVAKQIRDLPQEEADIAAKALLQMTARVSDSGASAGVQEAIFANQINKALARTVDWHAATPNPGFSAAERMAALRKEASRMIQLDSQFTKVLPQLSDTELKQYLRRVKVEGQKKAMQWVVQMKSAAE